MKMTERTSAGEQTTALNSKLRSQCENQRLCF